MEEETPKEEGKKEVSITLDAAPWLEKAYPFPGLTISPADHSTDNGILFLATLIALTPAEERSYWRLPTYRCLVACEIQPGLFMRYPGSFERSSVDNLVGAMVASKLTEQQFHKEIVYYGRKNDWCFDVEKPGLFEAYDWYGRFPGMIQMLLLAVDEPIDLVSQITVAGAIIVSALSAHDNTSDKCLQYLLNQVIYGKHFIVDMAIQVWCLLMNKKYPGGLHELYSIYFGADHFFSTHAPTTPFRT